MAMSPCYKKIAKKFLCVFVLGVFIYGSGRLYFALTGGFMEAHISSNLPYDERWETNPLSFQQQEKVKQILSQEFTYLGKGCQSYVFLSQDGDYVIKFFKYQRMRPSFLDELFSFIPIVKSNLEKKMVKKEAKREGFFSSWVIAFNDLPEETGLVYVHLNKSSHLQKTVKFIDKIGMTHFFDMDQMEFLIQKKAEMLCQSLEEHMESGRIREAKDLVSSLLDTIASEYERGIADRDLAIMQNSGVYRGRPVHIDVGQFQKNEMFKDPQFQHQDLYNKTWKFRSWLKKTYPELLEHLNEELYRRIGEDLYTLHFIPKEHE